MLPDTDPEFVVYDGNKPVGNDLLNRVQRAPDVILGSGSDGTFPAPALTTAAWGGSVMLVAKKVAGVANGGDWLIDDSINWLNRILLVVEFGAFNAANKLPGEGTENNGYPGYDYQLNAATSRTLYTKAAAAGSPPAGGTYAVLSANAYLYVDAAGDLYMRNAEGAIIYPFIMLIGTDQFPTRV